MNLERIVSSRLNPLKVSVLIVDHDSFLIGQRSHDLCLCVITLHTSVGLSSHSRRNVCIFDKASDTQHIIHFLLESIYPLPPFPLPPPPHTHTHSRHEIVFCYTILEQNKRLILATPVSHLPTHKGAAAHTSHINQLDSFFPFDPYYLKRLPGL